MPGNATAHGTLDPSCPGDPEREAALSEFVVLDISLHNESGPMMIVDGIDHDVERLLAFATVDDALGGWLPEPGAMPVLRIEPGHWGYSRRIKHCERYTDGWGCDNDGDWHRHFVDGAPGGRPMTLIGLELHDDLEAPAEYDSWWDAKYGTDAEGR